MRRLVSPAVALAVAALAPTAGATTAGIRCDPAEPVAGRSVVLHLEGAAALAPGARVSAIYRPGSRLPLTEELGPARPVLDWVPGQPGLVRLEVTRPGDAAPVARSDVAVRYPRPPVTGLVILLVAGTALFAGVALGLRQLSAD